jgi:hypothetical protein
VPDVFINYRTRDEEGIASLIDSELVRKLGRDRVFFASQSIRASDDFTKRLLPAVRASRVVLAVIGPAWLTVEGKDGISRLADPKDWTRREILAAFEDHVPVIPVIVGRTTGRLTKDQLPGALHRLVDLQSVRFDHRHRDADLAELFRVLGDFVSGMDEKPAAAPAPSGQTAGDHNGVVFQGGNNSHQQSGGVYVGGNAGNVVSGNQGPLHTGKGNQYNGESTFPAEGGKP